MTRIAGILDQEDSGQKKILYIIRAGTIESQFNTDQEIISRLSNTLGHSVTVKESDDVLAADMNGKDLGYVAGSVLNADAAALATIIKSSTIPFIVSKGSVQFNMDMAAAASINGISGIDDITINAANEANPVAAGKTGVVEVYNAVDVLNFGWDVGGNAVQIAHRTGTPTQSAIYYYLSAATMLNSFDAPAKRAGFFFSTDVDETADALDLFDALIEFMLT